MVNLESLKKLVTTNSFSNLVNQKDLDNIQSIIDNNPEFFNQNKLLSGVLFIQELNNKSPKERTKYGFRVSQPTGIGQWQDTNGVIYNSKFLNYLIGEKNVIFDANGIVEELIFFESVPLFEQSIELICTFVSELLKKQISVSLSEFLTKVDGLSDEYVGHDYFIRNIHVNYETNSVRLFLYKETDDDSRLKELISHVAPNNSSKFWQNAHGISDCCQDRFYDPDTITGMIVEITPDGLNEYVGYSLQPAVESVEKYKESSNIIIDDIHKWQWINDTHRKDLNEWMSHFGFKNMFIGFQVETSSNQIKSRIIYGNDGFY